MTVAHVRRMVVSEYNTCICVINFTSCLSQACFWDPYTSWNDCAQVYRYIMCFMYKRTGLKLSETLKLYVMAWKLATATVNSNQWTDCNSVLWCSYQLTYVYTVGASLCLLKTVCMLAVWCWGVQYSAITGTLLAHCWHCWSIHMHILYAKAAYR